jgi:hypothetical protein
MKRMSDVFELPITDNNLGYVIDRTTYEEDLLIIRAINHVDALADALARVVMNAEDRAFELWLDKNHPSGDVSEVQYKFEQCSEFKDFIDEFGEAQKVLAAYRGEK